MEMLADVLNFASSLVYPFVEYPQFFTGILAAYGVYMTFNWLFPHPTQTVSDEDYTGLNTMLDTLSDKILFARSNIARDLDMLGDNVNVNTIKARLLIHEVYCQAMTAVVKHLKVFTLTFKFELVSNSNLFNFISLKVKHLMDRINNTDRCNLETTERCPLKNFESKFDLFQEEKERLHNDTVKQDILSENIDMPTTKTDDQVEIVPEKTEYDEMFENMVAQTETNDVCQKQSDIQKQSDSDISRMQQTLVEMQAKINELSEEKAQHDRTYDDRDHLKPAFINEDGVKDWSNVPVGKAMLLSRGNKYKTYSNLTYTASPKQPVPKF
jgi:hypothetical protein